MMRSLLTLAVLVATVLAGCADPSPQQVQGNEETEVDEQLVATKTTGVIRGVVVDEAIIPLEGAKVRIASLKIETTSLADGSFGFSELEPGAYFLDVTKPGYKKVQVHATVEAGVAKPAITRVLLEADLASLPHSELLTFNGYLQCGVGFGVIALSTNPCALTESVNVFNVAVQKPINMTQIEMDWEGTNVFGDGLNIGILIPGTISNFVSSDGPSPRILPVEGTRIADRYGADYEAYTLRVFPGTSTPISVVLEQPFAIYVTHFYGFTPDPEWAFVFNGEYQDPR